MMQPKSKNKVQLFKVASLTITAQWTEIMT